VRLVFFGTPAPAVPVVQAVAAAGHEVALVVTQPPRRRGRGATLTPSPVHAAADTLGVPVRTPDRAREVVDELAALHVEAGVVAAFGQLLPAPVLAAVPFGLVNLHLSLLPRWRGAAPVERAILAGDAETGVSVMRIDAGLDTGPVYATVRTPIGDTETGGELTDRLVALGTPTLVDVLAHLPALEPQPQTGDPTYADKLTVDEFHLDPAQPAARLVRLVRAGNPRPGAWLRVDATRVKVLRAHPGPDDDGGDRPSGSYELRWPAARLQTAAGSLLLDEVQPEGRRVMTGDAWLAGSGRRRGHRPVS
jgi:methionyl-tRNA formyltransferase